MEQTNNTQQKTSSALATALRVIGVLSIIGGFGTGMDFYNGAFRGEVGIVISCTLAGIMTCLICFAIANCTQAASIYLDKIKQNNEKTSATNQPKKDLQSANNNARVRNNDGVRRVQNTVR